MEALKFNIDALKFPDTGEAEKPGSSKSLSRILSPLKSNLKPSSPDSPIPKEYLPSDYKTFLVLRDFLQPYSTIRLGDAVDRILEVFPDGYSDLQSINTVCFELAEQIPYRHPSQLKLARLLWLIGRSQKRIVKSRIKACARGNSFKRHLTYAQDAPTTVNTFYQHLLEDLVDNRGNPGDDGADPSRYVNYQAFVANLMEVGVWLPGPSLALYAMRGTFQESHEGEGPAIRDAWALGAAQWILWNGQGLFKLVLWPGDGKMEEMQQITLKDWHTWRARFREIAGSGKFGEECRTVAGKAANMMDMLERVMSF
jgi:hypothetical protein